MTEITLECEYNGDDTRVYRVKQSVQPFLSTSEMVGLGAFLCVFCIQIGLYHKLDFFTIVLSLICAIVALQNRLNTVVEESVLVIRETGVQLTKTYASGRQNHKFIDKAKIRSVVINEGFTNFTVIFYLAFILATQDDMVLAFDTLYPRMNILRKVYRGTRAALYGEPDQF